MKKQLRVGVALATYNGEQYLEAQLNSIAGQQRRPSVLCVADDGSTDASLRLIERWQTRAPFEVRVLPSLGGHGPTRNFERACRALGDVDVISFCDQDDIWYPHKLQCQLEPLDRDPAVTLSFVNAHLLRGDSILPSTLWDSLAFSRKHRNHFSAEQWLLRRTIAFGITMAVRRNVFDVAFPFSSDWGHDNWTAVIAVALGRAAVVDQPCMAYRQHSRQVSGGASGQRRSFGRPGRFAMSPSSHRELAARLSSWSPDLSALITGKAAHLEARLAVRERHPGWIYAFFQEMASRRYANFSNGLRSAASDVFPFRNGATHGSHHPWRSQS